MLKKVIITNYLGESMEYAIEGVQAENPSGLLITSIDGLGPVKANINMTDISSSDGHVFNSARQSGRNIVIRGKFTNKSLIEDSRLLSYRYFPVKEKVHFEIETDAGIYSTDGYVESNEPSIFSKESECQISILCETPYFQGGVINEDLNYPDETVIGYIGDYNSGMKITVDVPLTTPADKSRVVDFEITKDYDSSMVIDTDNFVRNIPDTAPKNVDMKSCMFAFTEDKTRYLGSTIKETNDSIQDMHALIPIDIDGELHYFGVSKKTDTAPRTIRHYKITNDTFEVVRLDDVGYDADDADILLEKPAPGETEWEVKTPYKWGWLLELNNVIYLHVYQEAVIRNTFPVSIQGGNKNYMFTYNKTLNKFTRINSAVTGNSNWYNMKAVKFGNKIHLFSRHWWEVEPSMHNYIYSYAYRVFDGNTWTKVEDTNDPSPGIPFKTFIPSGVTVYNNAIHLFKATSVSTSGTDECDHLIYDGFEWTTLLDECPSDINGIGASEEFDGKVYLMCNIGTHGMVYAYDGSAYEYVRDTPGLSEGIATQYEGPAMGVANGAMFIIGNDYSYKDFEGNYAPVYYTEAQNNNCLIENDKLLINTNKGNKSIRLIRDGVVYNVLNSLGRDSKWLEFHIGNNKFVYSASESADALVVTLDANELYKGV